MRITPQPPHREINKTAIGATQTVNWGIESALTLTKGIKAKTALFPLNKQNEKHSKN